MMKLFKYNTVLLLMMFGGLVGAGMAYATTSAPTPGPSVGHRAEVSNLGIGYADGGSALSPHAGLTPRMTVRWGGMSRKDKDGDPSSAAHVAWTCNWYRVPMDGTAETQLKSSLCNDAGLQWTIQSADIGSKLKLEVIYRSGQAAASAAGYTINPVESLPISAVTANPVSATTHFSGITVNGKTLPAQDGFPSTGFSGAKFRLNVAEGTPNDYIWSVVSGAAGKIEVTPMGEVVMNNSAPPGSSSVTQIRARSKKTNIEHIYRFTIKKWFSNSGAPLLSNLTEAQYNTLCSSSNGSSILPHATDDLGTLISEWGEVNESNYPGSGFYTAIPNHPRAYYAATTSPNLTGVYLGDGSLNPNPPGYLVACVLK